MSLPIIECQTTVPEAGKTGALDSPTVSAVLPFSENLRHTVVLPAEVNVVSQPMPLMSAVLMFASVFD